MIDKGYKAFLKRSIRNHTKQERREYWTALQKSKRTLNPAPLLAVVDKMIARRNAERAVT